ncbi:hypothetical protein HWV62_26270 [Athelia sp. TMB]|nr:hypothetical protein HWV62_26270 [Athelia sp. TMB]
MSGLMDHDLPPGPTYEQLKPFLPSVRHLSLQVGRTTGMPIAFDAIHAGDANASALTSLETFQFQSFYDMVIIGEEKEAEISAFLHKAPRLRNFFWFNNDKYRMVPPCALNIPWPHLSQLQLCRMLSHIDILSILNQTPLLEKCAFGMVHIPSQLPAGTPITTLQHLQSFYIKTVLDLEPLFNNLKLPALRAISINFGSDDSDPHRHDDSIPPWPQVPFQAMIMRSECNVERLHLNLHITDLQLLDCMQTVTAGLKSLHVHGIYLKTKFKERFFQRLTVRPAECLCPQLQEISLDHCDTYAYLRGTSHPKISRDILEALLQSRIPLVSESSTLEPHEFLAIAHGDRQKSGRMIAIHDALMAGSGMKLYLDYWQKELETILHPVTAEA